MPPRKGGNKCAVGRAESCKDQLAIHGWLNPLITCSEAFSYTTDRCISATNREVLLIPKYQALFVAGRVVSQTWCYCVSDIAAVLATIAKALYKLILNKIMFQWTLRSPSNNLKRHRRNAFITRFYVCPFLRTLTGLYYKVLVCTTKY